MSEYDYFLLAVAAMYLVYMAFMMMTRSTVVSSATVIGMLATFGAVAIIFYEVIKITFSNF